VLDNQALRLILASQTKKCVCHLLATFEVKGQPNKDRQRRGFFACSAMAASRVRAWNCPKVRGELLRRSKGPIAAHLRAVRITSYDSEMVGNMRSQSADVRSNVPVRVPSLTLHGRGVAVTRGRAILEVNSRGQRMRIQ